MAFVDPDLNIKLGGEEFEPLDESWVYATDAQRKNYWRHVGTFAIVVYRGMIRRGLDADGKELKPVKRTSRPDRATGPPLTPHYGMSRTSRLLAMSARVNGCTIWWRAGWSRILGYHAIKRGPRRLPVRNVLGIYPAGRRKIAAEARRWWRDTLGYGKADYLQGKQVSALSAAGIRGVKPPRSFEPSGLIDLTDITFGTGNREQVERSLAAGTFGGFTGKISSGHTRGPSGLITLRKFNPLGGKRG